MKHDRRNCFHSGGACVIFITAKWIRIHLQKFPFENFRRSISRRFNYRIVEFHVEQEVIDRTIWARIYTQRCGGNWYDDASYHRRVINLMHEREYRHRYADDNERPRARRMCRVCILYYIHPASRDPLYESNSASIPVQSRYQWGRRPISLDDYSVYHILFRVQCNWLSPDRKCAAF